MTPDDLRAAARVLLGLHERFAPLFGRKEPRAQSLLYLHDLLGQLDRTQLPLPVSMSAP